MHESQKLKVNLKSETRKLGNAVLTASGGHSGKDTIAFDFGNYTNIK